MNATAVVSCPQCLRQYEIDPATERVVAQCGGCKAHFAIVIPRLTGPADGALLLEQEIELRFQFFKEGCEALARNICELLRLAGYEVTTEAVIKLVRSLPRDGKDIKCEKWRENPLNQLMELNFERHRYGPEWERFERLVAYFVGYVPCRSYLALDMLQAAFEGVLGGIHLVQSEQDGQ